MEYKEGFIFEKKIIGKPLKVVFNFFHKMRQQFQVQQFTDMKKDNKNVQTLFFFFYSGYKYNLGYRIRNHFECWIRICIHFEMLVPDP